MTNFGRYKRMSQNELIIQFILTQFGAIIRFKFSNDLLRNIVREIIIPII